MAIDRIIDPNMAINAYSNMAGIARGASEATEDESGESGSVGGMDSGTRFADFIKDKGREAIGTMHEGERQSALAVSGDADITDVVQAVTAAELTLNTAVAVRDRMVGAYQEIMRMPI